MGVDDHPQYATRAWSRLRRAVRRWQPAIDVLLAAALAASWWWELARSGAGPDRAETYALAGLATLPVALRGRFPRSSFGTTAVALTAVLLVGEPVGATAVGVAFTAYSVITSDDRAVLVPVVGLSTALTALSWWRLPDDDLQSGALDLVLMVALLVVAEAARTRGRSLQLLHERAARVEHERAADLQQAVGEERARIARELHDVVAHSMSQISVQSGMGRLLAASQPARAVEALAAIEELSREALVEMRTLTGSLRDPGDDALRPQPGLDDLAPLLANVATSGVQAVLTVTGAPRPLSPALGRAVYRIVQESLTNVVKHAGPAEAAVCIHVDADRLSVTVTDGGPVGRRPETLHAGGGHGLVGMGERARTLGGELTTGSFGSGYRVAAVIPIGGVR